MELKSVLISHEMRYDLMRNEQELHKNYCTLGENTVFLKNNVNILNGGDDTRYSR